MEYTRVRALWRLTVEKNVLSSSQSAHAVAGTSSGKLPPAYLPELRDAGPTYEPATTRNNVQILGPCRQL
jgi:hypothetical protein